jgi:transposase
MSQDTLLGIDVGSKEVVCALQREGKPVRLATFANDPEGHDKLLLWAHKHGGALRACLEATGVYGLDLAVALHRANAVEVMVVNPRAIKDFARANMVRAKTDLVDAQVILAYLQRMPFHAWQPPSPAILELRALARRIVQLKTELARERNRLHSATYGAGQAPSIVNDIGENLRHLERRIDVLEGAGLKLIQGDNRLSADYTHLVSVKGIATSSAIRLLGELLVLPQGLKAPQWVAHAGLDPRPSESGTSIHKPRHVSKTGNAHLRAALYMPALVAIQYEPQVRAFYQKLIEAKKTPLQAVVAVMRKMLHAIWGMLKHDQNFDGNRFYSSPSA